MLEHDGAPRGALRVGGVSIAEEQLAVGAALGCERVLCLAPAMSPEILALQHTAERAGVRFQVVTGPRGLLGQVSATDELVAFADGLFASVTEAQALLEPGPVVLVQPAAAGIDGGFERIDHALASGGALRIPGRLVERLADLPGDYDAFSALLRIALQAGVAQRQLSPVGQAAGFWLLLRGEEDAHALEPQWIRRRTKRTAPFNPSRGLAQVLVRNFGPALLHAGSGARFISGAAGVLAAMALGFATFGWPALLAAGLSWIGAETAMLLDRVETERLPASSPQWTWFGLFAWLIDAALVGIVGHVLPHANGEGALERYFPGFVLIALLRILPRAIDARWTAWAEDRALLALMLGFAIIAGVIEPVVFGLAVVLALLAVLWPRRATRLTQP